MKQFKIYNDPKPNTSIRMPYRGNSVLDGGFVLKHDGSWLHCVLQSDCVFLGCPHEHLSATKVDE